MLPDKPAVFLMSHDRKGKIPHSFHLSLSRFLAHSAMAAPLPPILPRRAPAPPEATLRLPACLLARLHRGRKTVRGNLLRTSRSSSSIWSTPNPPFELGNPWMRLNRRKVGSLPDKVRTAGVKWGCAAGAGARRRSPCGWRSLPRRDRARSPSRSISAT
jgi:hypothetical protein